jgi:hypothetical protein
MIRPFSFYIKKLILVLLAFLLLYIPASQALFSFDVHREDAAVAVRNWLLLESGRKGGSLFGAGYEIRDVKDLVFKDEKVGYVVELSPKGFALVPVTTALSPIKMISLGGEFQAVSSHPFISILKERLYFTLMRLGRIQRPESEQEFTNQGPVDSAMKVRNENAWDLFLSDTVLQQSDLRLLDSADAEVTPLVTSYWHQGAPFNWYTPLRGGQATWAGCVAVAQAQVMYYWKHPASGQGFHSYYWKEGKSYVSADFNHAYDWAHMRDKYVSYVNPTQEEKEAAARLMADVGISIDSSYGTVGTGAHTNDNNSLVTFFKYSPDLHFIERADFTSWDAWFNQLKAQIDIGRPSLLGTFSDTSAHAIVVTGYKIDATGNWVYVNLGWGDDNNTKLFKLDAIYNYGSLEDKALVDIHPQTHSGGGNISGTVIDSKGDPAKNIEVRIFNLAGDHIKSVFTAANGSYLAEFLGAGVYKVYFEGSGLLTASSPGYGSGWYSGKDTFETADNVIVTTGITTSGINSVIDAIGAIKGRVTQGSGAGVDDALIIIMPYDRVDSSGDIYAHTDSDGYYDARPVNPYDYIFYALAPDGSGLPNKFFHNKTTLAEADILTLAPGVTLEVNIDLVSNGPKKDLVGSWTGQGVYCRSSNSGGWMKLASPASKVACGDFDNDYTDDLVGIWPSQGGVWVNYSSGGWAKISTTADWIAAGDMNGDGRDDLLGTWSGQGTFYRDSATGIWTKLATSASKITCGDMDHDGADDLIGIWPSQGGVWVKYSSGDWAQLSTTADWISSGDMNGDGRVDLLGTWSGQGTFYRDSSSGEWVKLASSASQTAAGDMDEDGTDDLMGIWPTQAGVWCKYSATGQWQFLASTADWITCGKMESGTTAGYQVQALAGPRGGPAMTFGAFRDFLDLSAHGPGGAFFVPKDGENLIPHRTILDKDRIPGPGETGFTFRQDKNLSPGSPKRGIRER